MIIRAIPTLVLGDLPGHKFRGNQYSGGGGGGKDDHSSIAEKSAAAHDSSTKAGSATEGVEGGGYINALPKSISNAKRDMYRASRAAKDAAAKGDKNAAVRFHDKAASLHQRLAKYHSKGAGHRHAAAAAAHETAAKHHEALLEMYTTPGAK